MARLPTFEELGNVPVQDTRTAEPDFRATSAAAASITHTAGQTGEGAKALGRGLAQLGEGISTGLQAYQATNDKLNEALATSSLASSVANLNDDVKNATDPSTLKDYPTLYNQALTTASANLNDQQKKLFMAVHGPEITKGQLYVGSQVNELQGQQQDADAYTSLAQLRDSQLKTDDPNDHARAIATATDIINSLSEKGRITPLVAAQRIKTWTEDFAKAWVGDKPPEERAAILRATLGLPPALSRRSSDVDIQNVDPRLVEVVSAGATHLPPGYTVQVNEGYNSSGHAPMSQHHIAGRGALDVQINGPNGPIHNEGNDTTGMYGRLAKAVYVEMKGRHPELDGQLAWGGNFGTVPGGETPDLMHFDIGGDRGHLGRLSQFGGESPSRSLIRWSPTESDTRADKNFNPGNIAFGDFARAHGATGSAGMDVGHGVAVFASPQDGFNAMAALARQKYEAGKTTADQLIAGPGGWTPGNHGGAADIARRMGLTPNADLQLDDPARMAAFQKSLAIEEGAPRHVALLGGSGNPKAIDTRLPSLIPHDQLVAGLRTAETQIEHRTREETEASKQERVRVHALMTADTSSLEDSGVPVAELTPERVAASLGEEEGRQFAEKRALASQFHQQTFDFNTLSEDQMHARADAFIPIPGQPGYDHKVKYYDRAQKLISSTMKLRDTDPAASIAGVPLVERAASVADRGPAQMQDFANTSLAMQSAIGIPLTNQRILTRAGAQDAAGKLMQPGVDVAQAMRDLQNKYGATWPKVFSDMVSLGGLPSTYQAIATLSDPNDAALLARAVQQGPGTDAGGTKSWQERITTATGDKHAYEDMRTVIQKSLTVRQYADSLATQGLSGPSVDAVIKDIETLAFAKSVWSHDQDAAEHAIESFTKKFEFMPNGGARVPSDVAPAVRADANAVISHLDKSNISLPGDVGGHGQPSADDYVNIIKGVPNWMNSPAADGMRLIDHNGRYVRNTDGAPVEIKFANAGEAAAAHHAALRAASAQADETGGGIPVELGVTPLAKAGLYQRPGSAP